MNREPEQIIQETAQLVIDNYVPDEYDGERELRDAILDIGYFGQDSGLMPPIDTLNEEEDIAFYCYILNMEPEQLIDEYAFADYILYSIPTDKEYYMFERFEHDGTNFDNVDGSFINRLVNESSDIIESYLEDAEESNPDDFEYIIDEALDEVYDVIEYEVHNADDEIQIQIAAGSHQFKATEDVLVNELHINLDNIIQSFVDEVGSYINYHQ